MILLCQILLWPVALLLWPVSHLLLPLLFPWARERRHFELKNTTDPASLPFKNMGARAHITFEVSSEGELEQVRPLIDHCLLQEKLVEIVYCSASVEARVHDIYQSHPSLVRLFRLPLLTYHPLRGRSHLRGWMSSSVLVLCRYDFFPELLVAGARKGRRFILVSATLKGKHKALKRTFSVKGIFYRWVYKLFDEIVTTSEEDRRYFIDQLKRAEDQVQVFDFRLLQVAQRQESVLQNKFFQSEVFQLFEKYLQKFPKENRLLGGSFWGHEAPLLQSSGLRKAISEGQMSLTIVPHQLGPTSMEELLASLKKVAPELPLYFIDSTTDVVDAITLFDLAQKKPGIMIVALRGILCELYTYFGMAYVGGGFGRSVHSLLEPFMASCLTLCGPKVHRSTEYDFIMSLAPYELKVVKEMSSLYDDYKALKRFRGERLDRRSFVKKLAPQVHAFMGRLVS